MSGSNNVMPTYKVEFSLYQHVNFVQQTDDYS